MADAKLTALTAASALAGADLFYVSQSAASRKATGTQLLALVGTTYVPLAGGTMTGALTLPAGSQGSPTLDFTGSGIFKNYANTLSISAGGAERLLVTADAVHSTAPLLSVYPDSSALAFGAASDIKLYRDAAATLAQRNGTTQQISRIYNTYTDSSNYERLTLTGVAGTSVNITAETLGTGGDNLDIVLTPAGTGSVVLPDGSATAPALRGADTNTGMFFSGNNVRFTSDGNSRLWLDSNCSPSLGSGSCVRWNDSVNNTGNFDLRLRRSAAGVLDIDSGTDAAYRDLKLRNLLNTEYHEMTEMTAPAAPATNSVRIYAEDNGAGKTRLMALFATGSAVQLGIEP